MEFSKLTNDELEHALQNDPEILLLDVMNPEFFEEKHIKGAKNAPVYEVVFLDHVQKIAPEKSKKFVLYAHEKRSFAAQDAAQKLAHAGYSTVMILAGGLEGWEDEGREVEHGKSIETAGSKDGKHEIDAEKSVIKWTGRNAKYAHHGKINVKHGYLNVEFGGPVFGEVTLDTQSIADEDIQDPAMRGVLEKHLKSSDFFDVENFPEAKIVLNNFSPINDAHIGQPNYKINAELSIKDVTREIEFLAMISNQADGSINGQAHFDIDRTLWNVRYGSEKFFEKLGMHLVNDVVSLDMFLVAKP